MRQTRRPTLQHRAILTLGFLGLCLAIVAAYSRPATGYELSIYRATPLLFWVGIGVGLLAAMAVVLTVPEREGLRNLALGLAGGSVLAVVALPILRNYYFYGAGDSLRHLGTARELQRGAASPYESLYPAIHLIANYMSELAGVELTRGLVVVPTVLFPLASVLFFGYVLRTVVDSRWAYAIGVFVGLLFVPINKVSLHFLAHPSSQTVLFVPVALYLLVRYLTSDVEGFSLTTPDGALLALASVGLVFLHPQEAMNMLILLFGVVVAQLFARRVNPHHAIAKHRPIGTHAVVLGLAFVAWTFRNERARNRLAFIVESLALGGSPGGASGSRGSSLAQLGGSVEEIFVKLFAVTLVFCLLAALVTLYSFRGRFRDRTPTDPIVGYFALGAVPLMGSFFVVYMAQQGDHYLRFFGFLMVPVAILGAIGLTRLIEGSDRRLTRGQLTTVLGVVLVVMLSLQLVTVHMSPYIYQSNQQVTEQSLDGHENAIEYHDGEAPLTGIGSGEFRYIDAILGTERMRGGGEFPGYGSSINETQFNDGVTEEFDQDWYVVLSTSDRQREVQLYEELRYSEEGFQRFERDRDVHRVQDNGEFRLYRYDAE